MRVYWKNKRKNIITIQEKRTMLKAYLVIVLLGHNMKRGMSRELKKRIVDVFLLFT